MTSDQWLTLSFWLLALGMFLVLCAMFAGVMANVVEPKQAINPTEFIEIPQQTASERLMWDCYDAGAYHPKNAKPPYICQKCGHGHFMSSSLCRHCARMGNEKAQEETQIAG